MHDTNTDKSVININRVRMSGYQGASSSARARSWGSRDQGPNTALSGGLNSLRSRSRTLRSNNPWVNKGINSLVANEIGKGITPKSLSLDHKEEINNYWSIVAKNSDPEGVLNFYGQEAQISRSRRLSGEVFIRKRLRRNASAKSPIQFQVIEPDYVPADLNRELKNGNIIRSGIELNKYGQRVAYWMYLQHPLERRTFDTKKIRIPAKDVIHHYLPIRPGQMRGEPDVAQSIVKAFTYDSYEDRELQRKDGKSGFTGFIKRDPAVFEADSDKVEQSSMNVTANTLIEGLPGEEPIMFDGDNTGAGYADFARQSLLGLAAGLNIPYEILTGDWSKVNDRLVRAILNEFRRDLEMVQDHLMIHQVCQRSWEWAINAGQLMGWLNFSGFAENYDDIVSSEWSTHEWPYVHPVQDVDSRIKEIDAGLKSRQRSIADRNGDVETVDNQRKEDMERERKLKLSEDPE